MAHHQGSLCHKRELLSVDGSEPQLQSFMEDGGWYITQDKETRYYKLWYVPQFGGEETVFGTYTDIVDAIKQGRSWT